MDQKLVDDVLNHLDTSSDGHVDVVESASEFDLSFQNGTAFKECLFSGYDKKSVHRYVDDLKKQTMQIQQELECSLKKASEEALLYKRELEDANVRLQENKERMVQYEEAIKKLQLDSKTKYHVNLEEVEQELKDYIQELEEKEDRIRLLEKERDTYQDQVRALMESPVEVSDPKMVQELKDEVDGLRFENERLLNQVSLLEAHQVSEEQIANYEDAYKKLMDENNALKKELMERKSESIALKEDLVECKEARVKGVDVSFMEMVSKRLKQDEEEIAFYMQRIKELREESDALLLENARLKMKV